MYYRRLLLALAVMVVVAAGCSGDSDSGSDSDSDEGAATEASSEEPIPGGTLVFGLAVETSGYNPAADQIGTSGYQVTSAIYDALVRYDVDGHWQPNLAESIVPNDDFTEWEIRLREGVEFHDGTALDSTVLKLNLDAQKDSPLLGQAVGAIEQIDIVDDLAVNVVMNTPWSSFPDTLAAQPGIIAATSVLEDADGGSNPVGTGPFVFEEWIIDKTLTVTRNDNYWRSEYPLLDGIEFRIIADSTSRSAALRSGDVDIIEARNGELIAEFEDDEDSGEFVVYVDDFSESAEDVVFVNTGSPPFDDPVAREAVATAIDRQTYSEVLTGGRFAPANGPFKEGSPWNQDVEFPGFDPDKAAELAAEYEDEHGVPIEFAFTTSGDAFALERASLLQQMLAEVGIVMTIETGEATATLGQILVGDYQASRTDLLWGSSHPDTEYVFLHGDNAMPPGTPGIAFTRVANPDIDAALEASRATDDPDEQIEQWGIIQRELANDMNWIFLLNVDLGNVGASYVRDVLDSTLPDGTPAIGQIQNNVAVAQIWLDE